MPAAVRSLSFPPKSLGMAGIEVDGPHTDIVRIKEIGLLPVLVIVVGLADSLLRKKR